MDFVMSSLSYCRQFTLLALFSTPDPISHVTGVTPAEKLLELYHGKWGCSVDPVFEELLY